MRPQKFVLSDAHVFALLLFVDMLMHEAIHEVRSSFEAVAVQRSTVLVNLCFCVVLKA
jgi:hypothetical protein